MFSDSANRRYTIWTASCWTGYMLVTSAVTAISPERLSAPWTLAVGVAVAAPVALHVWATLDLIRTADEFARALTAKRFILAWGFCLVVFSAWGLMEGLAGVGHAPGWVLYPLFWLAFGVVSLAVRSSR